MHVQNTVLQLYVTIDKVVAPGQWGPGFDSIFWHKRAK
jgi:hypothetical protein